MAGIDNPNLPSLIRSSTLTQREVENPDSPTDEPNWSGGLTDGGSCNVGLGINTGDYDPKDSDWSRDVRNPQLTNHIGAGDVARTGRDPWPPVDNAFPAVGEELTAQVTPGSDENDPFAFVQTAGDIAPGGSLIAGVVNRTGKTVPNGSWAWGTVTTVAGQAGVNVSGLNINLSGNFDSSNAITLSYTVDGDARTVVYDVLGPENAMQVAMGLANEFTVDPDVTALASGPQVTLTSAKTLVILSATLT